MTIGRRAVILSSLVLAAEAPDDAVRDLAPHGALRAAINFGNPVLAVRDPATGAPGGVSVDLARALAAQLGVPVTLVPFEEARQVFEAAKAGAWDVAFLAVDPVRAAEITFTAPYALIEGCYLVPATSPLHDAAEADQTGVQIAVARGSAYDLYLTRTLQHATLVRFANSDESAAAFLRGGLDAIAGVKQPLLALAAANPGTRMLDGRFMTIGQAMGTVRGHEAGAAYVSAFIAHAKASGLVAMVLTASGHAEVPVP